jgi:hypothetical protein
MNLKLDWSRRSFVTALGTAIGSLFAPAELNAAGMFGKKPKVSMFEEEIRHAYRTSKYRFDPAAMLPLLAC